MKFLLVGIALWSFLNGFAQQSNQKPEKVYSIAKEIQEISWYETQLKLWKAEIDKDSKYGDAWVNYYRAARALKNLSEEGSAEKKKYRELSTAIVADIQKAMPNSFEYYFIADAESGFAGSSENLKKAEALRPYDPLIVDALMIHYHLERNQTKFTEYATQMFQTNDLAAGVLNWGYNVLSELDENAILFTCGDNDTYAGWIVQAAKSFRKDVTVVNTSLARMDDYRNSLFKELGYEPLVLVPGKTDEEILKNDQRIFEHFFKGKRPVYVATTAIGYFNEGFADKLYLTGLAYKYSETSFDNESIIRRNYEKRYLLDYLKEVFSYNITDLKGIEFNGMYLPSLVKLYQQYAESEETFKMAEIEALLMRIAIQSGRENEILEILSESSNKSLPLLTTALDLKTLEKNMVKVNDSFYIDKYEVTNEDYSRFLQNLKLSGNNQSYNEFRCDSTKWTEGKLAFNFNNPMRDMYSSHPAYGNYPVVNISHEAAKAYCEWLTKQYNLQRKRTYTQVLFRLPTPEEWRLAAGSGDMKATNPFNGPFVRNSKGCYLANIQPEPGKFYDDGGFFMVKASSYEPNKLGLYNVLGNVAEMTSKNGEAKGGSWYNLYEECSFDKVQKYAGPNPETGFRIVMEIIEQ